MSNVQILKIFQYLLQPFPIDFFKFSRLFNIFYNHFFSNLQILRTFQYLLQPFLLKSSHSPDFSPSFTIISCQILKFSGLFSIFYNHFLLNPQILQTFHYLLQSFPFKSSNSPDFSLSFTITSFQILKFSGLFSIFYNHFLSDPQILRTFQYFFATISSRIVKFSGLFSIFHNHFFSNLQILRTFQYLLQSFPLKSSNSPDFSVSFTTISFHIFKFSGLFSIFYNIFFSNLQILRSFQYLLQPFPFESSNSPDFSVSFTTISFQICQFSGFFSIFYNHFLSNPQILRTFRYLLQPFPLKS